MAGIVNKDLVKAKELDFWKDREHKDKLLSLPDEAFTVYRKETLEKALVISGVNLPDGMMKGDKVFFSVGNGGVGVAELIKVGHKKTEKESVTSATNKG